MITEHPPLVPARPRLVLPCPDHFVHLKFPRFLQTRSSQPALTGRRSRALVRLFAPSLPLPRASVQYALHEFGLCPNAIRQRRSCVRMRKSTSHHEADITAFTR